MSFISRNFLVIFFVGLLACFIWFVVYLIPESMRKGDEARIAQRAMLEAGPTQITPVRSVSISGRQINIVYITPDGLVQGATFDITSTYDGYMKGRVIETPGSSEMEWYNDGQWHLDRIKQIRLSSQDLRAIGSPHI